MACQLFNRIGVHMPLCTSGIYALCLSFSHDFDYGPKYESAIVVDADVSYELLCENLFCASEHTNSFDDLTYMISF